MSYIDNPETKKLFKAIISIETEEECKNFFEDICTIKEMQDLSQRLQVASLLKSGANYQDVSKLTGASTATISRVNKCLLYGNGGYREILEKIEGEETK